MNFLLRLKWRLKVGKGGVKIPLFRPLKPSEYFAIQGMICHEILKQWFNEVAPIFFDEKDTAEMESE